MKKIYPRTIILFLFLLLLGTEGVKGQLLTEQFEYGASNGALTTVSGGNWVEHSAGTQQVNYDASGSLSLGTYPTSGGKATFTTTGQDVNRAWATPVTSGTLYVSFLVNITSAQATGDYFFHTGPNPIGTTFNNRVFARLSGGNLQFGIQKGSATPATYGTTNFSTGTTYLIVVKYQFNSATTSDDVSSIFVFSTNAPATEPGTPEASNSAGTDPTSFQTIAIRQGTAANAPAGEIDYIRVGTTWAEVTSAATPTITVTPATLSGFTTTVGSPSASQNYSLSGSNLTPASDNITVTAPTDYEVSTDNTTFSGSVSVPYSGGTLSATTIYVRIAASAPAGSPSGNVSNAGGGATTQDVAVSGTVVVPIANIRNSISPAPNLEQVAPFAVGTPVIVRGVLHGVNRNVDANPANGTKQRFEFALIDNSGVRSGITVRLNGTVDVAPIDLQEGDSVQVSGTVGQFRGLTQVNVTSITRFVTGRPRKTPVTATVIGEDQESNLIRLDNVTVAASAWPPTPHTGSGFNVNITVGSNTYVMRITSASELFNKTYAQVFGASEPTTGITIIGVGGQFGNTSPPFNTGYQIFPYRLSDIIAPVPIVPELGSNAPTSGFDFGTVRKNEVSASVSYKLKGKDLPITGSNTNTVVTAPANFQVSKNNTDFFDFITFTNAEVMADSVNVFVRFAPVSEINGFKGGDITNAVPAVSPTLNVNVAVRGTQAEPLSLADELAAQVKVYPNPARNTIQMESNQWYEVELQDITGRTIANFASNEIVKIDNLANGLYILQFKKDNIKFAKRLIVQK
jgi:hypothetical protein